jgi:hypothetical protein
MCIGVRDEDFDEGDGGAEFVLVSGLSGGKAWQQCNGGRITLSVIG